MNKTSLMNYYNNSPGMHPGSNSVNDNHTQEDPGLARKINQDLLEIKSLEVSLMQPSVIGLCSDLPTWEMCVILEITNQQQDANSGTTYVIVSSGDYYLKILRYPGHLNHLPEEDKTHNKPY